MTSGRRIKELAVESAVYGLPSILQRFVGILTVPIFSRILSPADYGILGVMQSVLVFVTVLVVLGVDNSVALYYYDAKDDEERKQTVATWIFFYLGVSTLAAAGMFALSGQLAGQFLGSVEAGDIVRLVAVIFWLTGIWSIAQRLLRIQRKKWWVVSLTIVNTVLTTGLSLLFVAGLRRGVRGMYYGQVCAAIPYFVLNLWVIREWLSPRHFSLPRLRQLLTVGLPVLPASVAYWAMGPLNNLFLEHYRGLGDVGLYTIGSAVAAAVALLTQAFQQAWGPFAFSIQHEPTARQTYARVLTYFALVTCAAAATLAVFTPEILRLLTPKSYAGAGTVVAYLAFASIGHGVYYIASIGVNLVKKTSHIGWTTLVAAGVTVGLNFLLVPRLGMMGAAIGTLVAHWLSAALLFVMSQQHYPIPYRWRELALIVTASAGVIALGSVMETAHAGNAAVWKLGGLMLFPVVILLSGVVTFAQLAAALRQVAQFLGLGQGQTKGEEHHHVRHCRHPGSASNGRSSHRASDDPQPPSSGT